MEYFWVFMMWSLDAYDQILTLQVISLIKKSFPPVDGHQKIKVEQLQNISSY
jgi:hypothetical protein